MICLGTLVNVAAIVAGGTVGLVFKKILSERITETVMQATGLAVVIVGLCGTLSSAFTVVEGRISTGHILLMIISLALGALFGELLKIEDRLEAFGKFMEKKLVRPGNTSPFAQGFVTATIVFCVGAMAIVGSLEDGMSGNSTTLFTKSVLDGIIAMIFASTLGFGVLFSAVSVGGYQGALTLLAMFVAPYLPETVITQISIIGSILIMSIGFNLLKISKIKVGNMLPAIFIPIIYNVIQPLVLRIFQK